jgi:hypothetical protein
LGVGEVNAFSDGNDLGHFCVSVPKSFTFDSLTLRTLRVNWVRFLKPVKEFTVTAIPTMDIGEADDS